MIDTGAIFSEHFSGAGTYITSIMSYAQMADETQLLNGNPTVKELSRYIILGPDWYIFGTQLGLDHPSLKSIRESNDGDDRYRTTKMFELWLNKDPSPTRQKILNILREKFIGLNSIANDYEHAIKSGSK